MIEANIQRSESSPDCANHIDLFNGIVTLQTQLQLNSQHIGQ